LTSELAPRLVPLKICWPPCWALDAERRVGGRQQCAVCASDGRAGADPVVLNLLERRIVAGASWIA